MRILISWRLAAFLLVATPLLSACSPRVPNPVPTNPSGAALPATEAPEAVFPPTAASAQGCYYVWATQELPDLGEKLQGNLAAASSLVQASAYAFGEDCRQPDGTTTFLAMETDFRVRIPVRTITDEAALGDWISRVMLAVEALPIAELPGTRPGRIEFEFEDDASQSLRLIVEISRYLTEARDLNGATLFQHFHPSP